MLGMARSKWILVALALAAACSSPSGRSGSPQPEPVLWPGNPEGCQNVKSVCLDTEPPQCFPVCADLPPQDGLPCSGEGDIKTCGDALCIVGKDESGQTVEVCPGMDCAISFDVSTGKETISCPSADAGVDGGDGGLAEASDPSPGN